MTPPSREAVLRTTLLRRVDFSKAAPWYGRNFSDTVIELYDGKVYRKARSISWQKPMRFQ